MCFPVKAMKRVGEIRQKREAQFIKNRVKSAQNKAEMLERDIQEVKRDIDLLKTPERKLNPNRPFSVFCMSIECVCVVCVCVCVDGPNLFSSCVRSEEHTSELQSRLHLVCRHLLEKTRILRAHAPT